MSAPIRAEAPASPIPVEMLTDFVVTCAGGRLVVHAATKLDAACIAAADLGADLVVTPTGFEVVTETPQTRHVFALEVREMAAGDWF